MKVKRIFNKEERNYYFVILKQDVKTIKANDFKDLHYLLNSKIIDMDEFIECEKLFYEGKVEVYG